MSFQNITIYDALEEIRQGNYLLPVFQRDFKWCNEGSEKIENLFNSIMNKYPISSMLFWKIKTDSCPDIKFYYFNDKSTENPDRVENNPYSQRPCDHLPDKEFYAILDGQQRLTALRIGIYGYYEEHKKSQSWNYLKGGFIRKELYFDISIEKDKNNDYTFKFKSNEINPLGKEIISDGKHKWLKVSSIKDYNLQYKKGIEASVYYNAYNLNPVEIKNINILRQGIFEDNFINFYEEETNDVDRAMKIFTRINNEGEPLSYYEIIYSILKANWSGAREEIEKIIENEKNSGFYIDIDYLVKAFLVLFKENLKNEIKTFDQAFCKQIEDNWERIRSSIKETFDLLKTYGMNEKNLISYNATLPILYYIYHKEYKKFATSVKFSKDREEMKIWLYQALLRHFFSYKTDTSLYELRNTFKPNFDKNDYINVSKFSAKDLNRGLSIYSEISDEELDEILNTRKDNNDAFLILSLIYPNIDYSKDGLILHKDHIHNENSYKKLNNKIKAKYPFEIYDSIVNLQLLTENENTSKLDASLDKWVKKEIKKMKGGKLSIEEKKALFLKDHVIPNIDLSLDNFDEFYTKRKKMIKKELKKLF